MAERNAHVHPIFRDILEMTRAYNSQLAARYAYRRPPGECAYCDRCRDDSMMPSHTASKGCESGKRPHCTCDACF